MAIQWSFEQKIIPRRLSFDELFDDTTASLG
jgi:4,5-dihydroxyphthalate decarboxylase